MAFEWEEYLHLARTINRTFKGEAARRTSISRAYYSMFCSARDCIGLKNLEHNVHREVILRLKNKSYKPFRLVGRKLDQLRKLRVKSDYATDKHISEKDASLALMLAEEIYKLLVEVCPNLTRKRNP